MCITYVYNLLNKGIQLFVYQWERKGASEQAQFKYLNITN